VQAIAAASPSNAVAAPSVKPATDHSGDSAVGRTRRSAIIASKVCRCCRSWAIMCSIRRAVGESPWPRQRNAASWPS
jgi:hypothetical protein